MKKCIFPVMLLFALGNNIGAKAQTSVAAGHQGQPIRKEGKASLDIAGLNSAVLYNQLQENIFTDLSVTINGQRHLFRVSVSDKVLLAQSKEIVYNGYEPGAKQNRLFLMVSGDRCFASIWIDGNEYTLAPSKEVQKAAFAEHAKGLAAAKGDAVFPLTCKNTYAIVDNNSIRKWMSQVEPEPANTNEEKCNTEEMEHHGETSEKTYTYGIQYPGYIGKRDLFLHIYDYGDVSDYDYSQVVSQITQNVLTTNSDSRFSDIRVVIIKHKRGETGNYIIDKDNLPWNNDGQSFFTAFENKVTSPANQFYVLNVHHMLLTRNSWNGIAGRGRMPGNTSMACCWNNWKTWFTIASHEFSHNLDADHTWDYTYTQALWRRDVMNPGADLGTWCEGYHVNGDNKNRIQNRVNYESIKDEVLDSTFNPTVANWGYAEDIVTVSDNTSNTNVVLPGNTARTGPLFSGQIVNNQGNASDDIKVYKVKIPKQGSNAQTYLQIKITLASFDTYLYVLDENGELIASDDESGGDGLSYISGNFNADKYYYIIVGGYLFPSSNANYGASGQFTLKVRYGWYQGGWKPAPGQAPMIEAEDGSMIETADFGFSNKAKEGLAAVTKGKLLEIYPNPVRHGVLHFKAEGIAAGDDYVIINSIGQVAGKGKLQVVQHDKASVALPGALAAGMYCIHLLDKAGGKKYTQKFVVE